MMLIKEKKIYENSKDIMKSAGRTLRKWVSNDEELSKYVSSKENPPEVDCMSNGKDVTYFQATSNQQDKRLRTSVG